MTNSVDKTVNIFILVGALIAGICFIVAISHFAMKNNDTDRILLKTDKLINELDARTKHIEDLLFNDNENKEIVIYE